MSTQQYHFSSPVGIISYGIALPEYTISTDLIADAWHKDGKAIAGGLGVQKKRIAGKDEDTVSLATLASQRALHANHVEPSSIGAVFIGSESHPYAVKPSATLVGQALGIGPAYHAADLEFACKAGTAAMQIVASMIKAGDIDTGLAIGSDTAQGAPGDALEFTAASGAGAYLFGSNEEEIIARLDATISYSSDTPDFWRGKLDKYPKHAGRLSGEPAYFHHVTEATKLLLEKTKTEVSDYTHVVFHMPNGRFPKRAAKMLGVKNEQLETGFIVSNIGNTYSACTPLGLARVLDHAKPGETILLTSYGSGSGSDSFAFTMTDAIKNFNPVQTIDDALRKETPLTYGQYVIMRGKL